MSHCEVHRETLEREADFVTPRLPVGNLTNTAISETQYTVCHA
jgi:hypothetical protein